GAAGDFDHPIASFGRAVGMVRALKETVVGRSVVVAFKAGEYHEENVTMTAEDSGTKEFPVIYCAYGDGEAVITGGVSVTEDAFLPIGEDERSLFPEKAADKIKKTYVGGILPGYGSGDVPFSENGVMTVARYPNKFDDGSDHLMQAGFIPDDDHVRITNSIIKNRIDGYHTLEGLQLYGYLTTGWYKDTLDTGGYTVDGESGGYDFLIPDTTQARMGRLRHEPEFPSAYYNSIALQNIPEELDHDGEYWVDADTLTMYVYDPRGSYTFPLSDNCIVMDGCDHVTFRGLTLTGYRDKILQGSGIVGLSLDRCRFSVCSSEIAITVNCRAVPETEFAATVTGCDFSVFAGRVLVINGRYLFDNNRVSRTNLTIEMHAALYVNGTAVFSHNEFEDCSYMAIGYNGCDNVIEYNTFKNCMYNSQDGGVIYCGQSQGAWGSVIRYNVFYPTEGEKYAVYLDDDKPAEEVCGNILFDTTICVHDGRSNNIHDNVMIRSDVSLSVGGVIELYEEYFKTGDPGVFLKEARFIDFYTTWKGFLDELDADPVMKERYFSKYPELSKLTADLDRAGDPDFVLYPRNYVRDNIYVTGSEKDVNATDGYSVVEGNKRFTLKENPIFVNPTLGDYRIRDGADFPDIRFEKAGRY
ncbi:MAG: hypothetical protein IIZ35_05865, partial [Clostridia bacterium]|nr:hypothetical protein [Clostridia bacterium]